jgi:hypothetical protein
MALTEYLLDTSKSIPDEFSSVLGGYGKRHGDALGVLWRICETIRHEKDG